MANRGGETCHRFSNKSYDPPPLSEDEIELAKLCQKFCNTCPPDVVERYGKGKLYNMPLNYFMYYDICGSELRMHEAYPWNRRCLEKLFLQLWDKRGEMQAEIDKAVKK